MWRQYLFDNKHYWFLNRRLNSAHTRVVSNRMATKTMENQLCVKNYFAAKHVANMLKRFSVENKVTLKLYDCNLARCH
jgi:hypothetical protein